MVPKERRDGEKKSKRATWGQSGTQEWDEVRGVKYSTAATQLAWCNRHNTYNSELGVTSVCIRNARSSPAETNAYMEADMPEISFLLLYGLSIWGCLILLLFVGH